MLQLTEEIREKGKIVELNADELPKGVLCRVTYPVCRLGEKNKNHRVYDSEVWEKVHKDEELQEKLEKRCLFGAAEHPQETQSDLQKTSHIIIASGVNEKDKTVYQTFDILNTPYGKIVNTILEAGCQVGVSTRAEGELEEMTEGEEKYFRVIPESYRYITTDFTADPSTNSPYPTKVERAVVQEIQAGLDSGKIDEEFSALLLEKFKCKEATKLLESMGEAAKPRKKAGKGTKEKVEETASGTVKKDDRIKIKEGEFKDRTGIVAKVSEGQISITLEDGTSVTVDDASMISITPLREAPPVAEPEPEPEPVAGGPPEEEVRRNAAAGPLPINKPGSESKKTGDAEKIEELRLGVDYIYTMKQAVKKAVAAIKNKDFEAAAAALEDVADDAGDAAKAAKKMKRDADAKAEIDAVAKDDKGEEKEPDKKDVQVPKVKAEEEPEPEVKDEPKADAEEPETSDEPVASEEPELVGAAAEAKVDEFLEYGIKYRNKDGEVKELDEPIKASNTIEAASKAQNMLGKDAKILSVKVLASVPESQEEIDETEDIKVMYSAAGLPAPNGKGVHTKAFHELAIKIAKGHVESGDTPKEALEKAYPTAMKQLGKEKAVKKASRSESKSLVSYDAQGNMVFECFDDMVKYFEKEFPKIFKERKEKEIDKLVESTATSSVSKRMRDLQIREASIRAERDKAIEFIEKSDDALASSSKSRQMEIKILSHKLEKIQEEKQREIDMLIATLEKRAKQLIGVREEIRTLKLKQIEDEVTNKKKAEKIDASHTEELKRIKETHDKEKMKLYIGTKLEHLGLQVHENTRALLEKCTSCEQVDRLIEETQDAIKKSALHSTKFEEVSVQAEVDKKTQALTDTIANVMESFNS